MAVRISVACVGIVLIAIWITIVHVVINVGGHARSKGQNNPSNKVNFGKV